MKTLTLPDVSRGLDNAGKTTIVKRVMNEDINGVSPTLGFIIKTIDYEGQVLKTIAESSAILTFTSYKLNICE